MAVRKSVTTLSASERQAFVSALKALKVAPSRCNPPTAGRYDDYVYVHMQAMLTLQLIDRSKPVRNGNWTGANTMRMPMWAHRCPAFLPWHRELLHQFESDLQAVSNNASLGLPYWDWTTAQSPTDVPWSADFLGGDGGDGPVTTGPFAGKQNWELTLSEDQVDHLVRGFGRDTQNGPRLPTPAELEAAIAIADYDQSPWSDQPNEATFRNRLEGWSVPPNSDLAVGLHNLVHLWVGGTQGTMLPSTSPNDPAFFLHHCNIDRQWTVWQRRNPNIAFYAPPQTLPNDPGQSLDEPMVFFDPSLTSTPPWSDPPPTPRAMINHQALGYSYDDDAAVHDVTQGIAAAAALPVTPASQQTDPLKARTDLTVMHRNRFRTRLADLVTSDGPQVA